MPKLNTSSMCSQTQPCKGLAYAWTCQCLLLSCLHTWNRTLTWQCFPAWRHKFFVS